MELRPITSVKVMGVLYVTLAVVMLAIGASVATGRNPKVGVPRYNPTVPVTAISSPDPSATTAQLQVHQLLLHLSLIHI